MVRKRQIPLEAKNGTLLMDNEPAKSEPEKAEQHTGHHILKPILTRYKLGIEYYYGVPNILSVPIFGVYELIDKSEKLPLCIWVQDYSDYKSPSTKYPRLLVRDKDYKTVQQAYKWARTYELYQLTIRVRENGAPVDFWLCTYAEILPEYWVLNEGGLITFLKMAHPEEYEKVGAHGAGLARKLKECLN